MILPGKIWDKMYGEAKIAFLNKALRGESS